MDSITLDGTQAFALYSLPNQTEVNAVMSSAGSESKTIAVNDITQSKGFLFSPFENDDSVQLIEGGKIESISLGKLNYEFKNKEVIEFDGVYFGSYSESFFTYLNAFNADFSKAILSRPIEVEIPEGINPIDLFSALNKRYPSAFVYVLYTSNHGLWLGATPETLLSETVDGYQTVALAGTQPYQEELTWEAKEKEEQTIVSDYIENQLKALDVSFEKSAVKTERAGDLAHLKTTFSIPKNTAFTQLLSALHPTPAVCGMPKNKALELIADNENYDRELYTGYLGPSFEETQLFVNLRCLQLFSNKARIYVGGGITKDSELEKEWQETELKAQTMLSVLEKNRTLHS